jgi:hypothetical protein
VWYNGGMVYEQRYANSYVIDNRSEHYADMMHANAKMALGKFIADLMRPGCELSLSYRENHRPAYRLSGCREVTIVVDVRSNQPLPSSTDPAPTS